jgi:diguanylate cyclase (GGDEF)-like protein
MTYSIKRKYKWTRRSLSLFATDRGKIILLAAAILLLAAAGVVLSEAVARRLLRIDAEQAARDWTVNLAKSADDLPGIVAGLTPSEHTRNLLNQVMEVGHIYRYKVWDMHGNLVLIHDGRNSPRGPATIAQRHGQKVARSILAGNAFTEAKAGYPPENPPYFAESYIPIERNGAIIGVFEAYVDETDYKALCEKSFLLTESIMAIVVLLAGGLPAFMVYRRMVDHRKAEAEALFLAEHDSLTGLPNRKRLRQDGNAALARRRRDNSHVAVLLFDMDRFKEVNDSFGHSAGDELLKAFAVRLSGAVRTEDTVARLGGDEFVVLQVGIAQASDASALTERLLIALTEPYQIEGFPIECGVTIGIAVAPVDAEEWDALLSCADVALYKAKDEGRGSICFFQPGMDIIFRERRHLETALRRALSANAFQLAYQPLFNAADGELLGFEALLRWPEGWNPHSPAEFIPVAEESGLIIPIGAWVLETACRTAASWARPLKIAVNLSSVQFRHGDIVRAVADALDDSGLDPSRLELEVTESLWLEDVDAVLDRLQRLRQLGAAIALDDFGTGYSSLTYLLKFPFDKVKIDRSFVTDMTMEPKAAAIVNTIVALGRLLNLTVTAEGVEIPAQAKALVDAGCDEVQGYLFGKPMTAAAAGALAEQSLNATGEAQATEQSITIQSHA